MHCSTIFEKQSKENQTMSRGGHRENAGRKRGTPNKATAARQAEVAASGITPLEMMLDNMRSAYQRALELEKQLNDLPPEELGARLQLMGEIARQRQIAQKCAADAANYVHPKLASIQHGNDPDNPLNEVTDADRAAVVLAYIAKNPKLLDQIRKQFH
jgi:hypothetical protein